MEVVLGMSFLSLSNADISINFDAKTLTWRSYTAIETLPTTSQIKLINREEFAKTTLDKNPKTFVVHVATLVVTEGDGMKVHSFQTPELAALQWDKVPIKVPAKYTKYTDIFSTDLAIELP